MGVNTYTLRDSSTATLGAASAQLLAFSSSRSFLLIENTHATNDVWVNLTGGTAAANGSGCILLAKGNVAASRILLNSGVPANAITAISTGANTTVTVIDNGVA